MAIVDLALLVLVICAKAIGFGATFRRGSSRILSCVRFYLGYCLLVDASQYWGVHQFGQHSQQYARIYWTTDISIVVLGYFILVRLVEIAFQSSRVRLPGLRTGAMLLFSGVATCTAFWVVRLHTSLPISSFMVNLEGNLTYLGMLLTLLLWVALNVLRVPGVRFRRVVLAYGVLYSSGAIAYMVLLMAHNAVILHSLPALTTLLAFGLLAYTLVTPDSAPAPALTLSRADVLAAMKPAHPEAV